MLTATSKISSASWPGLGTTMVLKVTDPGALAHARALVEAQLAEIDRACSRFRADSELELVNAGAGTPVRVSATLIEAVEVGLRAARLTDGDVDPALGEALVIAGYDRDYELLERPACERYDQLPCDRRAAPEPWRSGPPADARSPSIASARRCVSAAVCASISARPPRHLRRIAPATPCTRRPAQVSW
jgi:hypothetical protein